MNNDHLCIYHGDCPDGLTAAWIVKKWCKENNYAVEFHRGIYGDEIPKTVRGKHVLIVDFSYPRDLLLTLASKVKSLRVFDHHATAEKNLKGLDFCHFDMTQSGAGITWRQLFPNTPLPWVVQYVEDRDLWKFTLPHAKKIGSLLRSYFNLSSMHDAAFQMLDELCTWTDTRDFEDIVKEADMIEWSNNVTVHSIIQASSFHTEINGVRFAVANSSVLFSEVADKLCETVGFALVYYSTGLKQWKYSLRSKELDVSAIAEVFGGGGHKHAAGFLYSGSYDELINDAKFKTIQAP